MLPIMWSIAPEIRIHMVPGTSLEDCAMYAKGPLDWTYAAIDEKTYCAKLSLNEEDEHIPHLTV